MPNLDNDFKKFFPKLKFTLKDFQKKVIENVISNGNTLCVMPTGGGKSVVYWMTAAELRGITLVISPLIALIDEQTAKLEEQGYEVLALHSKTPKKSRKLFDFANGTLNPHFIFVSPERLATDGFFEACVRHRKSDIKLLVIDEVHCVSQWGDNFRPFYKRIPDFLNQVYGHDNWIKILALTATINKKETEDICSAFQIVKSNIIIDQEQLMRSDIQLHVLKFDNEDEKEEKFWEIVQCHPEEKLLVYNYQKKFNRGVENLCKKAIELGLKAEYFHGDMSANERADVAKRFRSGETQIIFATNAFGMGMDIPDIRTVIHFMIPESVEQYYQEIGRAGRDKNGANSYLLYTDKNVDVKGKEFIDRNFPKDAQQIAHEYNQITGKRSGYRSLSPFKIDEDAFKCFHYFQTEKLLQVECKGFPNLESLTDIHNAKIQQYRDSTSVHSFVATLSKNPGLTPQILAQSVYQALINGSVKSDSLENCFILNIKQTEIDKKSMKEILADIEQKKRYRHILLEILKHYLDDYKDSIHLHQEIAIYLGVDKLELGKIYITKDGNRVRSKSELIISEALQVANIKYTYEQKLYYDKTAGKYLLPDFTIHLPDGTDIYWEHVGMLGNEDYDKRWQEKLKIYKSYFNKLPIRTYESPTIATQVENEIRKLKTDWNL